jgi:sortase A
MTALDDTRTRPAAARRGSPLRRALHLLSTVLIVSGVLLMADAGLTLLWQEPLSALYNHIQQDKLAKRIPSVEGVLRTPSERRALAALPDPTARIAFAARAFNRKVQPGQAIGRIRIPRIGLSKVIVEGTEEGDLAKGPGHYPATPLPGAPGTVGIAGHRTTYGAPFRHVDALRPGDRITVQMPYATITYRVQHLQVVLPTATWVVDRKPYSRLVLTACHPLYSAARRIVVFARQVSERPSAHLS